MIIMGAWSNLVMIRGLGLRDPGSNPGAPIFSINLNSVDLK
jgi:hypothetical protein